ncbi:hypothetical protein BE08_04875 [Sorangium cellulosum]|uniref:Uncharacterized protein n=1 Tax=Sorangium cellulosum TaxID=56 RepID=A0A150PG09_SORCE|nr:hypothetical protein BE08_04875 [Sorangium cellulosum]
MLAPVAAPARTVETSRLLWRTRGEHWDYEFICVPEIPSLPGWLTTLEAVLGDADAGAGELRYGLLEVDDAAARAPRAFAYVAARFLDPARRDWTGRQVQHFAVWFPPVPPEAVDALPAEVPADWHLRVLAGLAATYGSGEVFGLPEEAIRAWKRGHRESRAARAMEIVKRTPPVALFDEGEPAPSLPGAAQRPWKRMPTLKKKSHEPLRTPREVSLVVAGERRGGLRRLFGCFTALAMTLVAVQQLVACGASIHPG